MECLLYQAQKYQGRWNNIVVEDEGALVGEWDSRVRALLPGEASRKSLKQETEP